jgi:subtilisin family serine protease
MRHKSLLIAFLLLFASAPLFARRIVLQMSPDVADSVATQYGLTIVRQIPNHNLFLVIAPDTVDIGELTTQLSSDPNVATVELDGIAAPPESTALVNLNQSTAGILDSVSNAGITTYYGTEVPSYYVNQPATSLIRLGDTQVRYGATGAGIVAIIDTGIDPNHAALQGVLLPGFDFTRQQSGANEFLDLDQSTAGILDQSTAGILDMNSIVILNQSTAGILDQSTAGILDTSALPADFGHGTMVAGIVHLVAPTAQILPLKAFSADGIGYVYDVISAIYYAVDVGGATVINMSFDYGQTQSKDMRAAINYANSRGVICVAAAGNSGQDVLVYPAGNGNVFGIASTTTTPTPDLQSSFTNFGSVATMAAPGEAIQTTYPGNYYAAAWGTSFSTPFVSGTVALLQQFKDRLSHDSTAYALRNAVLIDPNLGWGRLDAYAAVSTYAPQ